MIGFAAGFAEAYNRDVAEKKAEIAQITAVKREWLLTTGMQKLETRRAAVKESKARISTAASFGFDRNAAAVLESSGELTPIIAKLTKLRASDQEGRGISKVGVENMSRAVLENVSEENLAKAINYAFDSGAAANFDTEALIDIVFSTDNIDEGFKMVGDIPTGSGAPQIGSLGMQLQGLGKLEPGKAIEARKLIETKIAPLLGASVTESGWVAEGSEVDIGRIMENAFNYYTYRRADPMLDGDLESVTADIGKRIATLTSKGHNASEFTDYDFTTNPDVFLEGMGDPNTGIIKPVEIQKKPDAQKTDAQRLHEESEELIKKNLLPQ
tara:strand:+ start:2255 stop:3235 length:981 start_codon:yes stop_codon:yes gene_type:complete